MKINLSFFLILFSISTFPQNYKDFAFEIFFSRQPSAKTEAMGRILSVNFDPYFVSQSNPANLVSTNGIAVFYSRSSQLYVYDDATYDYAGISFNSQKFGALAFNYLALNMVEDVIEPPIGTSLLGTIENKRYLYTLTYSYKIPEWFSFGVNANLFVADFGSDNTYSGSFFEIGLSRTFNLLQDKQYNDDLTAGTQIKNIFNQSFTTIDEAQSDAFPTIFRIGLANTLEYKENDSDNDSHLFAFTLGVEYQDLFNANHRTAYKAGSELSLLNILFLRGGYYHETTIDYGFNSTGQLEEFTYGAGLKLDFNSLFTDDFPLIINFGYVSLKQPTYITNYDDWDNFTTFSLIVNYQLN